MYSGVQTFYVERTRLPYGVVLFPHIERAREVEVVFRPFTFPSERRYQGTLNTTPVVFNVPYKNKGCMVDTLVSRSDEGRDMAAISFGEVPNNL